MQPSTEFPCTVLEAASILTDDRRQPHSIELTVTFRSPITADRIRRALDDAVSPHPMARVRLRPTTLFTRRLTWEPIDGALDEIPAMVIDAGDAPPDHDRLVGTLIDPTAGPLFRLVLGSGGHELSMTVNHGAFDGIGALRLLRSILRCVDGRPDPVPPTDPIAARHHLSSGVPVPQPSPKTQENPGHLPTLASGGTDGYVVRHRCLAIPTAPPGRTVNDALVAAFHLALARWRVDAGQDDGPIATLVPVSVRDRSWRDELVGNHAWLATITTTPDDRRDAGTTVECVAAQSRDAKARPPMPRSTVILGEGRLPSVVARVVFLTASKLLRGQSATASISNLGIVQEFEPVAHTTVERVWFGPPCRDPRGISVGVLAYGGQLCVAYRARRSVFTSDSLDEFADVFEHHVAGTVTPAS